MKKVKHIAGVYDEDEIENDSSVGFDYSAFMSETGSADFHHNGPDPGQVWVKVMKVILQNPHIERVNCNRNSAITYFMRECKVFLDESNVDQVLDTYTQMCNISVNTDSLATMAATLANGGICPTTGRVCTVFKI